MQPEARAGSGKESSSEKNSAKDSLRNSDLSIRSHHEEPYEAYIEKMLNVQPM